MAAVVYRDVFRRRSDGLYTTIAVGEKLDYPIDWGPWLSKQGGGDQLGASVWTVPAPLVMVSSDFTLTMAVAWIDAENAVKGKRYHIVNAIVTAPGGREANQPFWLEIT